MIPLKKESKMNKTEAEYASILESLKKSDEIKDYRFEEIKFRLANSTFYTPDFLVIYEDRFEIHEVKGFWRDDARVKIKVAAKQFPWFRFISASKKGKGWIFERF